MRPLNQSTDYAIRMILCLAKTACTVPSSKLSAVIGVSPRYLLQIGAKLRDAGLISVTYGTTGGYSLVKAPERISLFEVIKVMEGSTQIKLQEFSENKQIEFRLLDAAYAHINQVVMTFLKTTTIDQLIS